MSRRRGGAGVVSLVVAFFAAASCAGAVDTAPRTFAFDDLRRVVALSSPAIAPDGKRVVVVVSHPDWNADTQVRELDLIDVASHARRVLTYDRKQLSAPRWSPDGSALAFLAALGSGDDAKPQVWVMPMDGGDARPITHAAEGVEQFAWRPDGGAIAFAAMDAPPKRSGAARFRDAFTFTTEPITARGAWRPVRLYVVAADGAGKARQLTRGSGTIVSGEAASTLSWSADGSTIALVMAESGTVNDADRAHIEIVDVASGKRTRLTTHVDFEGDPRYSPDGKHVAYTHSAGDNQINLTEAYVTAPGAGNGSALSHPFDRAVHDVAWLPDSNAILFAAHSATTTALVRAPLDGGALTTLDVGELTISSPLEEAVARDGSLAFVATSGTHPPELYVRPAGGGAPQQLTDFNARTAALALATPERVTFPTSLGVSGDGVLWYPPGYVAGKQYPLVLAIHGGPTSSSTRSWSPLVQLMAARGWLVLQPNYRGSDNLGLAYQRAVRYDPDAGPGKDVMAAVDTVRARGIVDERRIGLFGWSYGGIMTSWMISKYHAWRAAVSGASVDDWTADYGTADDSDADKALFHGSPFVGANRAEWDRASAISYAADVTTPLLILSDVGDNRDPFATSSMYYRALRDNGKDVTFVAYPIDGHFPGDPVRVADLYQRAIDFIAGRFH